MRPLLRAGLSAALLLAGAAGAEPPAEPPVEVLESGELTAEAQGGALTLDGGALLRRGNLTLRAGRAHWDPATRVLTAGGGVLLSEPGRILAAEELRLEVGGALEAVKVRAWLKEQLGDLSRCTTAEEAGKLGRNRITFAGERLQGRSGEEEVRLEGARITACDCGSGPPSWEVRASRADVEPGKRAILQWPVLYITPRFLGMERLVPVMALPWGYLPLSERQSGLLPPDLRFDGNGFTAALPIFLVIDRSWDATVTPEWITGPAQSKIDADQRGVRGPGLGLELRWAPAEGTAGLARVHFVHSTIDLWPAGSWAPPGSDRLALQLRHEQRLGERTWLAVDASAVGDPYYLADFTGDALLRNADHGRSAISVGHAAPDGVLSAEAVYLEPLSGLNSGSDRAAPFGLLGTDLPTFHRLPALQASLLPVRLAGPLHLSGALSLARFAPLRGSSGDQGSDGIGPGERGWGSSALGSAPERPPSVRPPDADGTEGNGAWDPGERLAASRALARAELGASMTAAGVASVEPWLAGTGAGYLFESSLPSQASFRLAGGVALSTELSRRWVDGEVRILHAVVPRAEWRFGTRASGPELPSGLAYDEQDVAPAPAPAPASGPLVVPRRALSAAPPAGFQQLRLALRNRLVRTAGLGGRVEVDLDLGQDFDLESGRRAETFAALAARAAMVSAEASARFWTFGASAPPGSPTAPFPEALDRFGELRAGITVGRPTAEVHASFLAYGPGGSQRLAAGADPLFDPRPLSLDPTAMGSAGFRFRWSAAILGYDLDFNARRLAAPVVEGASVQPHVFQQTARALWDSPCRCFRLGVVARLRDGLRLPSVGLTFELVTSPVDASRDRT